MEKKIIKVVTPNGIEIDAVIVSTIGNICLCYSQNRLFTYTNGNLNVLCDYCIIPELDEKLHL